MMRGRHQFLLQKCRGDFWPTRSERLNGRESEEIRVGIALHFHNSAQFPTTRQNEKATRQLGGLFFKGE